MNTYPNRGRLAGLVWPLPEGLDDAVLEALLYPPPPAVAAERRPLPDWAVVHRELRRPNMTLNSTIGRCAAGAPPDARSTSRPTVPALRELPPTPCEYATWKRCRVNLDYHVEIEKHFFSVPFRLLREEVEARITVKTAEIFHRGKLIAAHLRSLRP